MEKTLQTPDSSPSRPTGDLLLQRWQESKNLSQESLDRCQVDWNQVSNTLNFQYEQLDGGTATRYIDLVAWYQGTNDKWWIPGSKARGAWWIALERPEAGPLLLCEGETDALAAVQNNAPFSVIAAIPGANTICEEFVTERILKYHGPVVLAFDNDDAGRTARDKLAWWVADRRPIWELCLPEHLNDLRAVLEAHPGYGYDQRPVAQVPLVAPAPPLPRATPQKRTHESEEKPDLNRVWDLLSPRSRYARKDASGRRIRQAWCPLHDDGEKPGAWVGEYRWGCFVCGIESADVYELVGWVRGYAPPGQPLLGDSFREARDEARRLV